MKETLLQDHLQKTEIHAEQAIEKKLLHNGSFGKVHNGHILWELNTLTGDARPAEFEEISYPFGEKNNPFAPIKKKVIQRDNCVYIPALNLKSLEKKYRKMAGAINKNKQA